MELQAELEKWKTYLLNMGKDAEEQMDKVIINFPSEEDKATISSFVGKAFADQGAAKDNGWLIELSLISSLKNLGKIVPLSYIAETYLNQPAEWLEERLTYTTNDCSKFTEEETKLLNVALADIKASVNKFVDRHNTIKSDK
ncbi:MAG: hypothetical protein QM642_04450 [Edaphocola sp.]